mgnify:CR=1 FL=1
MRLLRSGAASSASDHAEAGRQVLLWSLSGLGVGAERGMGAMGPLMGIVLKELGGGADGKAVSDALKAAIMKLQ